MVVTWGFTARTNQVYLCCRDRPWQKNQPLGLARSCLDNRAQARAGNGFDRTAFTVDWDNQHVTCPQGVTNTTWSEYT